MAVTYNDLIRKQQAGTINPRQTTRLGYLQKQQGMIPRATATNPQTQAQPAAQQQAVVDPGVQSTTTATPTADAQPAVDIAGMQKQRANLIQRIQAKGGKSAAPQYTKMLNELDAKLRTARAPQPAQTPAQTTPGTGEATPPTDTNTGAGGGDTSQGTSTDAGAQAGNYMFPALQNFLPNSYAKDRLYQAQRDAGMKSLERLYAARGLTGSGAEIEGNSRFLNELNAQETARLQGLGQSEADRMERVLTGQRDYEANRADRGFDNQLSVIDRYLQQNPMEYAYDATKEGAGLALDQAKAMAKYLADMYQRVSPGGGGAAPVQPPPNLQAPNNDALGAIVGGANDADFWSMLSKGIAGFGG